MALSRQATEFAAEIRAHDWSDAPYRLDRAGHRRSMDGVNASKQQLASDETDAVRTNVMWVVAQVLSYSDPNFDPVAFALACGVHAAPGIIQAGIRARPEWAVPGATRDMWPTEDERR